MEKKLSVPNYGPQDQKICKICPNFWTEFLPYIQKIFLQLKKKLKTRSEKIAVKVYNTYIKLIKAEFTNVEELHSFQVDKSPFSFSSSLKPFRKLPRLLCTLLNLWSVSTIRLDSWEIQKLVQNTPSFNPYSCVTCYNPCVPLLIFITADDTPMLNVVRPTNIYFGHLFEIILFKYLLLFCAFPCKHGDNSSLILRFLNTVW